jgi:RHS repeat-associated protein
MKARVGSVFLACLAIPCWLLAQNGPDNDPDGAPGFVSSYFHHSSVDSVNLYNGNLTIPIALGPAYPVGPKLKFQAVMVYNSRVQDWGHPTSQESDFSYLLLTGDPALGIGWTFTLGAIKLCKQGADSGFCYIGPDGGSHLFPIVAGQYAKAKDGSQFQLHDMGSFGPYEMWDGDGNHYAFGQHVTGYDDGGASPGYIHDFGSGTDGWYLTEVKDPFGNAYSVTYRPGGGTPLWSYADGGCSGVNQTHMRTPAGSGSWIPQSINLPTGTVTIGTTSVSTVTGSMIGSFTFPVLVGNVSTTRTWTLQYGVSTFSEMCNGTPTYTTANLPVISAVQLPSDVPGSPSYQFTYGGCVAGLLSRLTLPTGATVDYQYGKYTFYHGRVGAMEPGCQGYPPSSTDAVIEVSDSYCSGASAPVAPAPDIPGGCSSDDPATWRDEQTGVVQRKETVGGMPGVETVIGVTRYTQYSFPFGERGTVTNRQPVQTLTIVVFPATDMNGASSGKLRANGVLFWGGPKYASTLVQAGDRTAADVEERVFDSDPNAPPGAVQMPACGGSTPASFCSNNAVRVTQRSYEYDDCNPQVMTCHEVGNRRLLSESVYYRALQTDGSCPGCPTHAMTYSNAAGDPCASGAGGTWEANGRHFNVETHTGNLGNDNRTIKTSWTPANWNTTPPANAFSLPNLYCNRLETDSAPLALNRYFEFDPSSGFLRGTFIHDSSQQRVFLNCRYPDSAGDVGQEFTATYYPYPTPPAYNSCSLAYPTIPPMPSNGDAFGKTYTYQKGLLTSTRWINGSTPATWYARDLSRDFVTGWITSSRDTAGLATTYVYDSLGRVTTITPPGEAATSVSYPSTNQTIATRNGGSTGLSTYQAYDYDGLGRLVRERRLMPGSQYAKRFYLFDGAASQYFKSEWVSDGTSEGLSLNLSTTCSFASGAYTTSRPSAAPGTYSLCFDPFGRPQQVVGSNFSSLTTANRTDGSTWYSVTREDTTTNCINGSLQTSGSCGAGGLNATTTTLKDTFGRVTSVTEPGGDVTSYVYDVNDKLTRVTQTGLPDRVFTFDAAGFLRSEATPEKGTVNYSYGSLGNILTESPSGVNLTRNYDFAGRVLTLTSDEQSPSRTYLSNVYNDSTAGNSLGKLTSRTAWNYPSVGTYTISDTYVYNGLGGRLSGQTTAVSGGSNLTTTQSWFYNGLGLLAHHYHPRSSGQTPFVASYDYDAGLPVKEYANGIPVVTGVGYQASGALSGYVTGLGVGHDVTTTIGQDPSLLPRPSRISTAGASPNFDTSTYSYDGVGNIMAIGTDSYAYDTRSRLTSASLSGVGSQAFTYDRYGNLLTKTGTPGNATFCSGTCSNNQVTGGSFVRGNLTSYGGQSFGYDGLDRMNSSTQSSLTWSYLYDGSDERAAKIPPTGSWTYTIRDESKRVASEFSGTTPSRDNVFLGSQLVASYANGGVGGSGPVWVFFASDHLGTPRLLTDVAANLAEPQLRRYWPFGEAATTSGTFEALRFATMEFDAEGGTSPGLASDRYYDHARSHVGGLGRFLSPDKAGGRASSPQSWNRYTYALDNPLRLVDPNGLEPFSAHTIARVLYAAASKLDSLGKSFSPAQSLAGVAGGLRTAGAVLDLATRSGEAIGSGASVGKISLAVANDVATAVGIFAGLRGSLPGSTATKI